VSKATPPPDGFVLAGTKAARCPWMSLLKQTDTHRLWWFMLSCSSSLRQGEHLGLFKKPEEEWLKHNEHFGFRLIKE
jgi:hypothetical protein